MYKIAFDNMNGERIVLNDITDEEYKGILEIINIIDEASQISDFEYMVKENCKLIIVQLQTKNIRKNFNPYGIRPVLVFNGLLNNLLASFYNYLEFLENRYKVGFEAIKKRYYDNFFIYRLIYNLRRYTTHGNLGITATCIMAQNYSCHVLIEIEEILKGKEKMQKIFLDELNSMDESHIDVMKMIWDFICMFMCFHRDVLREVIKPVLNEQIEELEKFIYTDSTGEKNTYLIGENNSPNLNISASTHYAKHVFVGDGILYPPPENIFFRHSKEDDAHNYDEILKALIYCLEK